MEGETEEVAQLRFSWLPLIPWAIAFALGIAALSVGPAHGCGDGTPNATPAACDSIGGGSGSGVG
ncbi:MAG TPA: hypothetical protein VFD92_24470 [Candidatus Binatia bacterium]|nr:hypothetical protein [Candidatus Binatia bacterium]